MQNIFRSRYTIVLAAIVFLSAGIQQSKAQSFGPKLLRETYEIGFRWMPDTSGARNELYGAQLIPVTLPGCPKQFYMQFDLGSPVSLFYANKIISIREKYRNAFKETTRTDTSISLSFRIGNMPVTANGLPLRPYGNTGIHDGDTIDIIGTIGADFVRDRIILIDYPACRLVVGIELPVMAQKDMILSDCMYTNGRIFLPAVIKGKKLLLYFDTGSSAFSLLTDRKTCESISVQGASAVQYPVNSWGRTLTAHTLPTNDSIEIAMQKIPIQEVTYIEGTSAAQVEQMMKLGIGGMTGNRLFLHAVLLLDLKNKKIGLRKGRY